MKVTDNSAYGRAPSGADLEPIYDVCIVGSGASGAVVAWTLARRGISVVVVEQGPHVTDDIDYDDLLADAVPAWVRQENGTWGKTGYPWTTCNVGGGTVFYGGALFRNRPIDFDPETVLGRSEMSLRWPWGYDELEPYYSAIEHTVGVAGLAGADPTLPPGARPYPLPPVASSREGDLLASGARALEWQSFPTPLGINSRPYRGRDACGSDTSCIGRRCRKGAKADAVNCFLEPSIRAGAKLFAGLKAVRLHCDERRRVEYLECVRVDSGKVYRFRAQSFVICGNAIQTAALLLRSTSDVYPTGLGNANDLVGRGLCFKLSEYVVGYRHRSDLDADENILRDAGRPPNEIQGLGPFSTRTVADHYQARSAPGGLGGLLYEARPERPFRTRTNEQIARIEALVPDEPQLGNRVRLATETDEHGVPDIILDYQADPRDRARLEYMIQRGEQVLHAAGCQLTVREASGWAMGSCHLHGTCRMGTDPAMSVTNEFGRVHDVDNLYIGDGAVLPFPAGANPTLTIQAVALRTAHHVLGAVFGITTPDSSMILSVEDVA